MIKGVIFDLDSTLCDSEGKAHDLGLQAMYESYTKEYPIDKEAFDRLFKEAKAEIKREHKGMAASHERLFYIQRMIEKTHNTVIPELIMRHYKAYWDTLIDNLQLFPTAKETLLKIKEKGLKTCIVSNLTSFVQFRKIVKLGITDQMDYLVTSQEAGVEKPHPAIFLLALNKMDLSPSEVLMVGDSLSTDVEGANAAKIPSVWLYTPREDNEEMLKKIYPQHTIKDISEILTLLEN